MCTWRGYWCVNRFFNSDERATTVDYPENTTRENRVRIVEPQSDREDSQPIRGILKRPTQKFPEDPNPMREGVKPLKEVR